MAMQTFINLPVKDLAKATEFFSAIGFEFDPQFTDENASRMIIGDETSVMLAVEPFFAGFVAPQAVADTSTAREVVVGLSAESRRRRNTGRPPDGLRRHKTCKLWPLRSSESPAGPGIFTPMMIGGLSPAKTCFHNP